MNKSDMGQDVHKRTVVPTQGLAVLPPRALAKSPGPGAGKDDEIEKLLAEFREAVRIAGMEQGDPLMPLVTAFKQSVEIMAKRGSISDRVLTAAMAQVTAALAESRHTANAEAERFKSALQATEADIIRRIAADIAASADQALTRRVKVFDRNTALSAAALLFGTALVCGLSGYVWGGNVAEAHIHETEVGLRAAFSNNPRDAEGWMRLMSWNDLTASWNICNRDPKVMFISEGRRGCDMPLWIEKPQNAKFGQH